MIGGHSSFIPGFYLDESEKLFFGSSRKGIIFKISSTKKGERHVLYDEVGFEVQGDWFEGKYFRIFPNIVLYWKILSFFSDQVYRPI